MTKVTVYIPAHNYGKYLRKAVESVLIQKFSEWELIVIDDGSIDNTAQILKSFSSHPKIRVIQQENKGLSATNNIALRTSRGRYIMRLDADDYLDENALLVLSNILDGYPEIGIVYPDYYLVDESGEILEIVRRKKIGEEVELLDLPAHGACTMIRKECLLQIGGYNEEFTCQDGYDLWLRFLESFRPYNVNTPLFYYRQHPSSITRDKSKILRVRGRIKRNFVERMKNKKIPKVLAVIPVIKREKSAPDEAMQNLAGKPLIWYTITQALRSKMIDKIVISTNDEKILDYCRGFKGLDTVRRPEFLTYNFSQIGSTLLHVFGVLRNNQNYLPEAAMVLYVNTPLRSTFHIETSIDTMAVFNVDTVISVTEEVDYFYNHEKFGLSPLNKRKGLSLERKALYRGNGAICLTRTYAIRQDDILGKTIGHIIMLPEESIRIRSDFEFWMAEKILNKWRAQSEKPKSAPR